MSDHTPACRWREPRDPCSLLVRAEGEGLGTVLILESERADGHYAHLRLDPTSLIAPTAGCRYDARVTGVADPLDLTQPVRVKLERVMP